MLRPLHWIRWYGLPKILRATPTERVGDLELSRHGDNAELAVIPRKSATKDVFKNYVVNILNPWNGVAQSGNPTRSIAVKALIKPAEKNEARDLSARRALWSPPNLSRKSAQVNGYREKICCSERRYASNPQDCTAE
jgi:hypothetical protein